MAASQTPFPDATASTHAVGECKFKADQGERFKSGKTVSSYSNVTTTLSLSPIYSASLDMSDPVHGGLSESTHAFFPFLLPHP